MSQIQLTVEEALAYQQLDAKLSGFVAGAQAMADQVRRMKVDELLARRKAQDSAKTAYNNSQEPTNDGRPDGTGNAGPLPANE